MERKIQFVPYADDCGCGSGALRGAFSFRAPRLELPDPRVKTLVLCRKQLLGTGAPKGFRGEHTEWHGRPARPTLSLLL